MKRPAAFILAAVMILSLAACSESQSEPGTDISIASQKVESKPDPDSSKQDPDSSVIDKLTPATTIGEDFAKRSYTDFEYTGSSVKNDTANKQTFYYSGSIKEDSIRQQVFEYICRTVRSKELLLEREQSVSGGGTALITLTDQSGSVYKLCDGILTEHPEEEGGPSVYIFITPDKRYHYFKKDYKESREFEKLLADGLQIKENLTRTEGYGGKKVKEEKTPVLAQGEFSGSSYSDFEYSGKTVEMNTALKTKSYYEGRITDPNSCKEVFELLSKYNVEDAIKLSKDQMLPEISEPIITLTYKGARQLKLSESYLVKSKNEEEAVHVHVLCTNAGEIFCYNYNPQITQLITQQLDKNIRTQENLVKTETFGTVNSDSIAFIDIYSNYAWVPTVKGTYVTKKGEVRSFDFSSSTGAFRGSYEAGLLALICDNYKNSKPTNTEILDTAKIKSALDYAAKVDPDAKVTVEHKMCDYGQNTLYAVVNNKLVMLYSKGDNDRTVEDINAVKAIAAYKELIQTDDDEN